MKEKMSLVGEDSHCSSVVVENLKKTVKYKSERQPKVMKLKLLTANQVTLLYHLPTQVPQWKH